MSNMMRKRNRQGGFTFMELMVVLLIFVILAAVVILVTRGFFSKARESAMDQDLSEMRSVVQTYAVQSGEWPTANRSLPLQGNVSIDFNASFEKDGKTFSFYPDFITNLPRHSDEGVWHIDSAGVVSVDMPRDQY